MTDFHPSVNQRINDAGHAYEKLFPATEKMQQEVLDFIEYSRPFMEKFKAMNNQMLQLSKEPLLPKEEFNRRMNLVNQMGDLGKNFLPLFSELIYKSKPLMDDIYNFRFQLEKLLRMLMKKKNNEAESGKLTAELENKLTALYQKHTLIRTRIDICKSKFDEIRKIYDSMIN